MPVKLTDIARVIRSKNAGPYELTLDIIFKNRDWYEKIRNSRALNRELISKLYNIPVENILNIIEFEPACAIKITLIRPHVSGAIGETDVYGAQQHAPLLGIKFADF